MEKRGKDMHRLWSIVDNLLKEKRLEPKYKDHILLGNFKNRRDCHIQPDWILIYLIENDTLILERTGSHSDLFK